MRELNVYEIEQVSGGFRIMCQIFITVLQV